MFRNLFLILFLPSIVSAAVVEVCPDCRLKKVNAGIRAAFPGDTVKVGKGLYREKLIIIDKSITLAGEGDATIIDGMKHRHVIDVQAVNVSIQNIKLINGGSSDTEELAGIHFNRSNNCSVKNVTLQNMTYGIYLAKVKKCRIHNNNLTGNATGEVMAGNGVHSWYSEDIEITGNKITKHRDGLYFEFTERMDIRNNKSYHNIRYGMHYMFSHHSKTDDNYFHNNVTGVAVMYSDYISLSGNIFVNSWRRSSQGILLKEINHSRIERNKFIRNTRAIFMDGVGHNIFSRNLFYQNGIAVVLYGSCADNIFSENDMVANFLDITTNTRESRNHFSGNYWDKYNGYDLDRNNKGDRPFYPVSVFGYWIARQPELSALMASPVVNFLEIAERAFPVIIPTELKDDNPALDPYVYNSDVVYERIKQ